ncbi:MAG: hypothetical protein Q8L27_00125 [archaeon]|nr:hypothetical protein [archaeon]
MADILNTTNIVGNLNLAEIISNIPGIAGLITLGRAVGIAVLVYLVFLIIRSITQILYSLRFKKLYKNVEEINKKMDVLIGKSSKIKKK